MKTLRDIGEFGLIRRLCRRIPLAGDDCAVLPSPDRRKWLLFTCDPVVEGIHYLPDTPPRQLGWKAMARNLSDIAAMAGLPRWAVVSIGLRPATPVRYVDELYGGLHAAARRFGCRIVGGDTTQVRRHQFVVVALLGEVEKNRLTRRRGAKPGDAVLVTGTLGGSLHGKHLRFIPRIAEARWLATHFPIHAMIDLSDGLASDLQRLVEANHHRIGFDIYAAELPIARAARGSLTAALHDGEDFELLFTIDPRHLRALRTRWARTFALPLTEIGQVVRAPGQLHLITASGHRQALPAGGYNHFRP
jgi:thiamine-monophosphate kinase